MTAVKVGRVMVTVVVTVLVTMALPVTTATRQLSPLSPLPTLYQNCTMSHSRASHRPAWDSARSCVASGGCGGGCGGGVGGV
jgi:uncharacterized membrane protein